MKIQQYGKVVLLVLLAVQISTAKIFRVAQDGSAAYKTIQSAVDEAMAGDIVQIEDLAVYKEQVTIDSTKNGLVLRSVNPTSAKKPTIQYQDTKNQLPKTYSQAQHPDSINFDQNGALRVMRARNVTINGIRVDGGGAKPFAWEGIWNQKDPLFHGNAAICLWVAGEVVVKNCDLTNAYFGVNVKDRNEGGIFANANPADIETWKIVPLSGFGMTGNHIFEDNKIHHNSWGMFFESVWDQGSIIRYNLFYENHHSKSLNVKNMPDGGNQPGGAIFFKDYLLSPLAIYNNTFWHNHMTIAGHWRAGAQHVVFNNIFAQPDTMANEFMSLDPQFVNRMHHCLYAAQSQRPTSRTQDYSVGRSDPEGGYVEARIKVTAVDQVRIMNGMDKVEIEGIRVTGKVELSTGDVDTTVFAEWAIRPGARITTPFGKNSTNRWFEMKFISTDTGSQDFLVPDWSDPDVERLVLDQGWPEAGIIDEDGSIADLGAIPKGGRATNNVVIKAAMPVLIDETTNTASVTFDVFGLEKESLSDIKVKYVRWIKNVVFQASAFGGDCDSTIVAANAIVTPTLPNTPIKMGSNSMSIPIPARGARENYAFFELILEGTNADGEKEITSVGFLPYRKVDYKFDVKILDKATGKIELSEVKAGEPVIVSITPVRLDGKSFDNEVKPCTLTLGSGFVMYTPPNDTLKVSAVKGNVKKDGFFTKVPMSGYDRVSVSGAYEKQIFLGTSKSIRILPGDPEKITFQDPPSNGYAIISGSYDNGTIKVEDKYGNAVGAGIKLNVKSTKPNIGDIVKDDGSVAGGADVERATDSTGIAFFDALVTEGDLGDTFPLVATLISNSATDNSKLVVGQKKPRFFIQYADTAKFDISVELRGCAGLKFPVTIVASISGDTAIATLNNAFDIDLPNGIAAYATEDASDTVRITSSALIAGKKKIWIKSTSGQQSNKKISITGKNDNSIVQGSRAGIYFDPCGPVIDKAAYFAQNGDGQVDRLEIWYKEELLATEKPDSLQLYWPDDQSNYLRVVKKADITLDSADAHHLIVNITNKFDAKTTSANKLRLGTSYWNDPNQPDANTVITPFSINDSVGPVLTYAKVVEKLKDGNDTMFIRISESIDPELIKGISLILVKKDGTKHNMEITEAVPLSDTIRIIVKDLGANSPNVGDSLQILSTGPITDRYTNKARPDNRPVPINIKLIPPNILNAFYIDNDADGIVDSVYVKFDKYVPKEIIKAKFEWNEGNNSTGDSVKQTDIITNPKDDKMILVNVEGKFRVNEVRTSGAMLATLTFSDFGSDKTAAVNDSAAPVLVKAEYCPGAYIDGSFALDTLNVTFSEETRYALSVDNPFNFYQKGTGTGYTINLQANPKQVTKGFSFLLKDNTSSITGVRYPQNNDTININASQVTFNDGNRYQDNPANRKVLLTVKGVPTEVNVKVGPNPFIAGSEVTFFITPLAKMVENVDATSTVVIYDQIGNKLWQKTGTSSDREDKQIQIKWNGMNSMGRKVGSGTYRAKVKTLSGDINAKKEPNTQWFSIGVKPNK